MIMAMKEDDQHHEDGDIRKMRMDIRVGHTLENKPKSQKPSGSAFLLCKIEF